MKPVILIVDDQADIRQLLSGVLTDEGYEALAVETGEHALEKIKTYRPHVVLLDVWLANPRFDGVYFLDLIKKIDASLPVIMISGHGTIEMAVNSLKKGAYDFIEKPFKTDRLLTTIARAVEFSMLRKELDHLRETVEKPFDLVGVSSQTTALKQTIERAAKTNGRVLIQGSSGVGKQSIARLIHDKSVRASKPFVVISCATLSGDEFQKKFLGIEGAAGVLETASEGTVYLSDIHDMPLDTQLKFLQILREGKVARGESSIPVHTRFICGTVQDLTTLVEEKKFHQDLYYRLNVIFMKVPDLCERCEDIPFIYESLIKEIAETKGEKEKVLTPDARIVIQSYDWPGNIRQLRNVIEWLFITYPSETDITAQMLPFELKLDNQKIVSEVFNKEWILSLELKDAREKFEKVYLALHMRRFNGNITKTSRSVGMDRTALHRKIRQLGLITEDTEEYVESE
jgi:two-component system, NtrC family, nitrogen regulation response regulator NtrX